MAVETYIQDELTNLITEVADLDKWKETCEALGLSGQLALANEEKSPIPFPKMNPAMTKVYSILCPAKTRLENYSGGTIPLRVLETLALCKQEGYFTFINIWSDDQTPDPIAVGYTGANEYSGDQYIIARWGDELRSFVELQQLAAKRRAANMIPRLHESIEKSRSQIATAESLALREMQGEGVAWNASLW